ncbi:aminoglycoside phosphotransferase family protein [Sphaerochaeta sp. PS]|uniref:phosphotransferase enzyme family protein n=1 Tax=Sphaerochaeta sp. PS TaxID=3076336 RepID=UPI0028A57D52|nr:aminoglycoside phosphotransferase family protein [Sphaerochaeta sp. PS]MDT4762765.1 aminoglycoside phosphotransferase family protein [Sphaerochaeta sp. PS]
MQNSETKLRQVIADFNIPGTLTALKANREGHINTTYISTFASDGSIRKYTHQRINSYVFKHPLEVMENISLVTGHIRSKLLGSCSDVDLRCLRIVKTRSGSLVHIDDEGGYWRTYHYIDHVKTFSTIKDTEQAFLLGKAIGNFQLQLADFEGNRLHETIPHFHDMGLRYRQLEEAMEVNHQNRLERVGPELAFLLENKERGLVLWDGMAKGKVPTRVTHNDTKINNVLFTPDGKEALCIIDLDTVMPGTILFDTGDMIRTATTTGEEDALDLSTIGCDVDLHRSLIQGYLSKADFLTPLERSLIVESGRNITQIMAVRFLTDYLNGDRYYSIEREQHNLDRARTQIRLMQDMDSKWELLSRSVE